MHSHYVYYCCSVLAALGLNVVGVMGTRVMLQEKGPPHAPLSKNRVIGPERSEVLFGAEPAALQMAPWWLKTAKTVLCTCGMRGARAGAGQHVPGVWSTEWGAANALLFSLFMWQ